MISICILSMNRLDTLKLTFEVLKNLRIENEVIVFDQNSTDGSVEFLKTQSNVKLFISPTNVGNSVSRNAMIQYSKYELVFLLDSDIVPIPNSIECLYEFMIQNNEYSFIGYHYNQCSDNLSKVTPIENGIQINDVITGIRLALTQYGLFRRNDLLKCPFPEFEPFNQEGWGAEDDMVGMAINDGGVGLTGMVKGRTYYHNHFKSSWEYIEDEVHRLYALRYIIYKYFDLFLSAEQKIQTLQTNQLPIIELDINKYYWELGNNFGDVVTDWIWNKFFPFFKLNENSKNLLFFGGSIIEHLDNAKSKFNIDFERLYMFGVGVYSPYFTLPNIEFEIYPRGYETQKLINQRGFQTNQVVGDVLQLLSLLPYRKSKTYNKLIIQDAFSNTSNINVTGDVIRICEFTPKYENPAKFVNMLDFLDSIEEYNSIVSSQIHPYYYYLASGKSAKLIPKEITKGILDTRPSDLSFINNFKLESTYDNSMKCRLDMQINTPKMIDILFNLLKNFSFN